MLTQSDLKAAYSYDLETGIFTRTIRPKQSHAKLGAVEGISSEGYVILCHGVEKFKVHRLAFLYVKGAMPINEVDHIDGNRSNNKWSNLREATRQENMQNISIRKTNTSGYRGVALFRGKWRVQAQLNNRKYFLGYFDTALKGSKAYEMFIKRHHGVFYKPLTLPQCAA